MTINDALSFIREQVIWDRLIAVVEEQAQTLIATGFSTSVREAGDVSAGVFDARGRLIAQAITGTPGHVNSMARSVGHFIAAFPVETMKVGDVFITNDPWLGTGHLHDFTVVTPSFHEGKLVSLFASTCHVVDIGGRGLGPEARQVYEEGLRVPIMHFADGGTVNQILLDFVRANVREPVQVLGDIFALVACNEVGSRRLDVMLGEFALADLDEVGEHILEKSRVAMLEAVRQLPAGTYRHMMRVDGFDRPVDIKAAVKISESGIDVDFTGTSGPSSFGINVPLCYTDGYSSFGVKCVVAPKVPNNAGSLSVIRVSAPPGTILNAQFPAPVAARHVIGQMLPDVMFGCLAQARGSSAPAEGSSCIWALMAYGGAGRVEGDDAELADAKVFNVLGFLSGGTGARTGKDGLSTTAFPSGVRNVSVEVTETLSPLLFRKKAFRCDSGGAGRLRGGLGQIIEITSLDDAPFSISANYDRIEYPAKGRKDGRDGAPGRLSLGSGRALRGKGLQTVPRGEALVLELPGGAGMGHPYERDEELVLTDVQDGFVSSAQAREAYGVVVTEALALDRQATAALRSMRNGEKQ
jgi:N-methylhydantoinase B